MKIYYNNNFSKQCAHQRNTNIQNVLFKEEAFYVITNFQQILFIMLQSNKFLLTKIISNKKEIEEIFQNIPF